MTRTVIGWLGWLGAVFVPLKLFGVIDWSWWMVTLPFSVALAVLIVWSVMLAFIRLFIEMVSNQ